MSDNLVDTDNEISCSTEKTVNNNILSDADKLVVEVEEVVGGVKGNCHKLKQGMVVKNYRKMCELLDEPLKTGDSRRYQLINWTRYFDYDKEGQKFIINKVYAEALPKIDNRKLRDQMYSKYIELLLMRFIVASEDDVIRVSKSVLLRLLGMMPPSYISGNDRLRENPEQECDYLKKNVPNLANTSVEVSDVRIFYGRVKDKVYRMFDTALASMQSRRLIEYFKEYNITEPYASTESHDYYAKRNKSGAMEIHKRKDKEFRPATNEEIQDILEAEHTVMLSMGYSNLGEIHCRNLQREFHEKSLAKLKKSHNWVNYYPQIKIIFLRDYIKNDLRVQEENLLKMTTEQQIIGLNGEVIKALKNNAERRYENAVKADAAAKEPFQDHNDGWGHNPYGIANVDLNGKLSKLGGVDFVEIQNSLTDYLTTINKAESIRLAKYINESKAVGISTYKRKFKIDNVSEDAEEPDVYSGKVWRDGQYIDATIAKELDKQEPYIDYSKL